MVPPVLMVSWDGRARATPLWAGRRLSLIRVRRRLRRASFCCAVRSVKGVLMSGSFPMLLMVELTSALVVGPRARVVLGRSSHRRSSPNGYVVRLRHWVGRLAS